MKRLHANYIVYIIEAIDKIEQFTKGMNFKQFEQDDKTIFSFIRALEIIGEAAKKILQSVRKRYNSIPWKLIAGMRDKLVHEYFGVDVKVVWQTVSEDIPTIKPIVKQILSDV